MRSILTAFFFLSVPLCFAQTDTLYFMLPDNETVHVMDEEVQDYYSPENDLLERTRLQKKEHPRLVAAILCLTLGPFGAHRLYLGTKPAVPVAYTLTLGGGLGILPVVDLLVICFARDISPLKNNPYVIMWTSSE